MSAGNKFNVTIDPKWCKKCGICAAFCPKSVFTFKAGIVPDVSAVDQCIGCKLCEQRCPDFAVSVVGGKKHEF